MWWAKEKHVQTSETWADSPVRAELSPDGSEPVELGQGISLWWNCWWTWRQCHTHHQCVKPFEGRKCADTGWLYDIRTLWQYRLTIHLDYTPWLYNRFTGWRDTGWAWQYYKLTLPLVDSTHHHCHLHVRLGSKWVNSLYVIGRHQPFDHLVKFLLASL